MQRYEAMLAEDQREKEKQIEIYIPPGPRLGRLVIEAQAISKAFGDKLLFSNLSFSLPPGGIVGIIGPNGAGKTTLFRLITDQDKPDAGSFKVGDSVKLAYMEQSRDSLNADDNVWQAISDGQELIKLGPVQVNSRA